MSSHLTERFLVTDDMAEVFSDAALAQYMLDFEAALAWALADCQMIPVAHAQCIAACCEHARYDVPAWARASAEAGSLAIPMVQALTREVALVDPDAAAWVHGGSTSQDVLDTAMVLSTRQALQLLDDALDALIGRLLDLGEAHAQTPILARTLMQPAQISSFGLKCANWAAPLQRARTRLQEQAGRSLLLQFGGAAGTLSALGGQGAAVRTRLGARLGLPVPPASWHTQRDEWVQLGLAVALLIGSLGKIATDLALLTQAELGELAESDAPGRGGSSAMPNKRNAVGAMVALAAAKRAPSQAAALLACMDQAHERGLGGWQAELAEWPSLWFGAHASLQALAGALKDLQVNPSRMRANIDAQHGVVFAEALAQRLSQRLGKRPSQALVQQLCRRSVQDAVPLTDLAQQAWREAGPTQDGITPAEWEALFSVDLAVQHAAAQAREQLAALRDAGVPIRGEDDR